MPAPEAYVSRAENMADGPDPDLESGPPNDAEDFLESLRLLNEHDPFEWDLRGGN